MTEFLATNPLTISAAESPRFPFLNSYPTLTARTQLNPNSHAPFSPKLSKINNSRLIVSAARPSRGYSFYNELEFEDRKEKTFGLERNPVGEEDSPSETGSVSFVGLENDDDKGSEKSERGLEGDDLVRVKGDEDGTDLKEGDEQVETYGDKLKVRRGKQVIRRSSLLAKQVISIRSALSLGFISQLWVDTTSWMVLFAEVRPNLLSGDSEKFLLEDISQVGDVVLVQDESVLDNEFKMVGLETLVGYKVVTPSRRNIGKVRGYTFSINSGAVEELELDSFGLSIIPSSLVSTYSLLVEDVLEVVSDAVVVHEAAALSIQRLSKVPFSSRIKQPGLLGDLIHFCFLAAENVAWDSTDSGFLGNQNVGISVDDIEEYDSEQYETYGHSSRRRKSLGRRKPNQRDWANEDNWELPMEYL